VDPVPGDPLEVSRLARRYRDTAEVLREQSLKLRQIAAGHDFSSEAWDALEQQVPEVADRLDAAIRRYEVASEALRVYGGELDAAQVDARAAVESARQTQREISDAERRAEEAQLALDAERRAAAMAGVPAEPDLTALRDAEADVEDARTRMRRWQVDLERAVERRDQAAHRAMAAIHDVISHDGLKNRGGLLGAVSGGWNAFKGWVGDHADVIDTVTNWASTIATAMGIAALAVGWVPVIGQAAAAILGAGALAFTAVALIGHLLTASTGHGSWLDVGIDAVALATFGIGRAFSVGAKTSYVAARAQARMDAHALVRAAEPALSRSARYLRVNALAGGPAGEALARASTVARAGSTAGPRAAVALESFSPSAITRETVDAWQSTREAWEAAAGARRWSVNMDLAAELGRLGRVDESLAARPEFRRLVSLGNVQRLGWTGTTLTAVTVDLADKFGAFDAAKPAFVGAP
jgi:hypothetical protein